MRKRSAEIKRKTKETDITVKLLIEGQGQTRIDTGIGILDHMLELFAFHGLFDLIVAAKGDFKIDLHHTNEDIGIVLGQVFKKALGDKKGIRRFGSISVPMEDVVASVTVDINGRGYFRLYTPKGTAMPKKDDGYTLTSAEHFFDSLAKNLGMNLVIKIDPLNADLHTSLEPFFKGLGIALDQATQIDPRRKGVPSTKGVID